MSNLRRGDKVRILSRTVGWSFYLTIGKIYTIGGKYFDSVKDDSLCITEDDRGMENGFAFINLTYELVTDTSTGIGDVKSDKTVKLEDMLRNGDVLFSPFKLKDDLDKPYELEINFDELTKKFKGSIRELDVMVFGDTVAAVKNRMRKLLNG